MMRLARELGYTLSELSGCLTREELELWALLYQVEAEEQETAKRKSRRR